MNHLREKAFSLYLVCQEDRIGSFLGCICCWEACGGWWVWHWYRVFILPGKAERTESLWWRHAPCPRHPEASVLSSASAPLCSLIGCFKVQRGFCHTKNDSRKTCPLSQHISKEETGVPAPKLTSEGQEVRRGTCREPHDWFDVTVPVWHWWQRRCLASETFSIASPPSRPQWAEAAVWKFSTGLFNEKHVILSTLLSPVPVLSP